MKDEQGAVQAQKPKLRHVCLLTAVMPCCRGGGMRCIGRGKSVLAMCNSSQRFAATSRHHHSTINTSMSKNMIEVQLQF